MTDERDNKERLQTEKNVKKEEKGEDPLSFISPTQVVELPSQGRFYPESNPVNGRDSLEIGGMTAEEEDILNNKGLIKKGVALDRVLNSLLEEEPGVKQSHLLSGDKSALLIAARIDAYTAQYEVNITCPMCANHKEVQYDIEKNSEVSHGGVGALDEGLREELQVKQEDANFFSMVLPKTGVEVKFRLLQGGDERAIASKKREFDNKNLRFQENVEQMKRFLVSLNGYDDARKIERFSKQMPAKDSRALRNVYNTVSPSKEMLTDFTCDNCQFHERREVPIRGTFFWPDWNRAGRS